MDTSFKVVSPKEQIVKEIANGCGSKSMKNAHAYMRVVAYRNKRCVCEMLGEVGFYFGYFGKSHFRLVEIAVRSEEQGKGYGSALMRRIVQRCRAEGAERITLRCSVEEGVWPFYVLHGFCIVGEKQGDYEMEMKLEDYLDR